MEPARAVRCRVDEGIAELGPEHVRVVQLAEHVLEALQVADDLGRIGAGVAAQRLEQVA